MNVIWLVWILFTVALSLSEETLTDVHLDLVLSLAEHFQVSSCVIGRKDFSLISTSSYPPKRKLLTNFFNFQEISQFMNGKLNFEHKGKTMIILNFENATLSHLKELSRNISLSPAIWILFSELYFQPDLFEGIYVPFDCEFIFISQSDSVFSLMEIYRIGRETEIETYDLGFWRKENGLEIKNFHFYSRRNNMKGHRLKAIIKNNPPYVTIERDENGNFKFKGYLYEIWSELEFRLNFRTEYPEDYFDQNPEQVLKTGKVDFAVTRISIVPSAFDSMDFSQPIHEAKSYMFGYRPGSELDWDSYLKPFSPNTWFVSIVWMFLSSLALTVLYKKAWDFGTSEREATYYIFTFTESLLTVFRAVCMQGSDVTPRSNACRLFFLSIYLTALVVTSAFSAALFSLLTIPKPRSPFNSLEEVLDNNKFQMGFPSDPDFHKLVQDFSTTLDPTTQEKLLGNLEEAKISFPTTPEEGVRQICQDKSYIFVFDLPEVLYLMQNTTRSCQDKILPSGPPLFTEFIGFGFKKNNPYKELINFHLIRMKNEGILNRLLLNYWPPQIPTVQATWVRVTLSDISPILYMFTLGAVLGAVFLHAEKIVLHFKKNKKKDIRFKQPSAVTNQLLLEKQLFLSGFSTTDSPNWNIYYKNDYSN